MCKVLETERGRNQLCNAKSTGHEAIDGVHRQEASPSPGRGQWSFLEKIGLELSYKERGGRARIIWASTALVKLLRWGYVRYVSWNSASEGSFLCQDLWRSRQGLTDRGGWWTKCRLAQYFPECLLKGISPEWCTIKTDRSFISLGNPAW